MSTTTMELTEEEVKTILAGRTAAPGTDNKRVLIGFVIDESGSMSGCVTDTIGGYNTYVAEQAKEPGVCLTTRILFSSIKPNDPTPLVAIGEVERLSTANYRPAGNTPLWDSVGRMFAHLSAEQKPADMVILVIITDGQENASREYTKEMIGKLRAEKEGTGKWTVVFMGADYDASHEASAVGVGVANTFNFDKTQTRAAYHGLSGATSSARGAYRERGITHSADLGKMAEELAKDAS